MTTRRGFITSLSAIIASPAIVRASSLMAMPRPRTAAPWGQKTNVEIYEDIQTMFRNLMARAEGDTILQYETGIFLSGSPVTGGLFDCVAP